MLFAKFVAKFVVEFVALRPQPAEKLSPCKGKRNRQSVRLPGGLWPAAAGLECVNEVAGFPGSG
jgi:hypothetical protein